MAGPNIAAAREAGYTDAEIADFIGKRAGANVAAAREAGYDDTEILGFLEKAPPKSESDLSSGSLLNSAIRQYEANVIDRSDLKPRAEKWTDLSPNTGSVKSGLPNQDVLKELSTEKRGPTVDTKARPSRFFDPAEKSGVLRQMADVPVISSKAAVSIVRSVADTMGADNSASKALRGVEGYLGDLVSAQSRQDSERMAEIMKEAEGKSLGAQVRAGLEALSVAPLDSLSMAAGSTVPILAASILAAFAAPVGFGGAAAVGTGITLGAASGTGVVKGSIYDTVRSELMAIGVPQDAATDAAVKAQEYKGDNLDQILLGTLIGGVAGATGAEAAVIKSFVPKLTAKIAAEKTASGIGKRFAAAGVAGLKEGFTEAGQEGQERVAQNVALQREGFDTPTFEGATGAATFGGVLGAVTGGVAGAISPDTAATPPPPNPDVDAYITNRDRQLAGEPTAAFPTAANPRGWETNPVSGGPVNGGTDNDTAAPIAESITTPGDSAVVIGSTEIPVAQAPQAPVSSILNAGDVGEAVAAAAQTAVSSPTSNAPASLDEMIDESRIMLDEQVTQPQQKIQAAEELAVRQEKIDALRTTLRGSTTWTAWEPDPANPDAGSITPESVAAQREHYAKYGKDVVFIADNKGEPFDGVVDDSQPDTIFLSSNTTRNTEQVISHEIGHTMEDTKLPGAEGKSLNDILAEQVEEGIIGGDVVDALELHSETAPARENFPNTPEGVKQHTNAVLNHLYNELGKDMMGDAPRFVGFVEKVVSAVEARYGRNTAVDVLGKFVQGLRNSFNNMKKFFRVDPRFDTSKWVNNLDKIHDTIAQMHAAKLGEVNGLKDTAPTVTPEAVIKLAEEVTPPPTRAGPKPREGYETAKKDAEVYKRWLGELDTKRRDDADKSPEVATLRAKEKEILGKVKGGEKYLSKTQKERLAKIRSDIESRVNPKEDNDDMALVRERMVEAQQRMADAASVSKEKTAEAPVKKPASGEPVRIGKPAPRPAEKGDPANDDRFVANQMAQDTGGKPQFSPKQQSTPGFVKWFGDSKVVDKDGKPLVVYHGSIEKGLKRFDPRKAVEVEGGIFFSSNPDVAEQYTFERAYGDIISDEPTGDVSEVYLRIENPLVWQTKPGQKIVDAIEMGRAIEAAKSSGHDGVIVRSIDDSIGMTGDVGDTYIVFEPTQIKSATGNSGAFDPKDPRIRFSPKVEKSPVFFSALERAVDGVKFDKAPPGQWLATIKNMTGVKAEEIKTSGIDKWLGLQTRPLTKAEVIDQLQVNAVQIEEVVRGAGRSEAHLQATRDLHAAIKAGAPDEELDRLSEIKNVFDRKEAGEPKFGTYRLPGGENYRELLVILPPRADTKKITSGNDIRSKADQYVALGFSPDAVKAAADFVDDAAKLAPGANAAAALTMQDRLISGGFGYTAAQKEAGDVLRSLVEGERKRAQDGTFKSQHWDEKNVLAHIRFDERTGPNGEKILHIAEIQSDWHQQGRREGYKDPDSAERLLQEARDATNAMYALRDKMISEATGGKYTSKTEAIDAADMEAYKAIVAVDAQPEMLAAIDKHDAAAQAYQRARNGVPDAPFKKTWHELAFKRALRYAVENGYDRVTWDTGDTNAERYDLSQQVSAINWAKRRDGTYDITVKDIDGETITTKDKQTPAQLSEIIGKEPTDRIINEDGRETKWSSETSKFTAAGSLTGDNLKVGGQGMRVFYDKILPDFVNKYVRPWGAKVERGNVKSQLASAGYDIYGVSTGGNYATVANEEAAKEWIENYSGSFGGTDGNPETFTYKKNKDASAPVHSLNITAPMRAAVMQGQPKFSPKAKPTVKDLQKEVPGLKKVVSNMTPEEMQDISKRTVTQLVDAFSNLPSADEYAAVAFSGRAKRGWYQHSAKAIVDVFGQEDGNRFTALLAALSPQTSVESNLESALRMWVNWNKAGRPQDHKAIGRILGQSVQGNKGEKSVLDAWRGNSIRALTDADPGRPDFLLSGPKVSSFAKNLRNRVDEVTNDAWMATFGAVAPEEFASRRIANKRDDIGKTFGFKSTGYIAASAKVREAAKILTRKTGQTWTPAEVQETVWSWAKTLYERRDRAGEYRTMEQILKAADLTHEDITGTPDFAVLLTQGIYRKILEGGKYDEALQALERTRGGDSNAGRPSGPSVSVTGAEGSGFTPAAYERHLQRAARRLERTFVDRRAVDGVNPRDLIADARDSEIAANMSAATNTIPGIARLVESANAGNEYDARTVNLIAHESLERLIATVPDAKLEVSRNGGLYGGALEPSLGVKISFPEKRRASVLAALAKFASNFNQEQIHVRQPTIDPAGRVSADGSYATDVYTFKLDTPLSRSEIEEVIAESGLYGLNFSDKALQAYFVGDPRDDAARAEFHAAADRARTALGDRARSVDHSVERLWAYGNGEGATQGYDAINGDVPRGTSEYTEIPRALAERELGHEIETSDQADEITEAQRMLQTKIADHYQHLPRNAMSDPKVRRSYEELAKVIQQQFAALPVKVEVWDRRGEPYKSSAEMRRDVLYNNHMWIYGTQPSTFGPPGVDFTGHPLLEPTGRESIDGWPLLVNDELRAVHDYYAHMMSPATFGPRGEETAWKNHLATIDNPWARWALTSETRGQNSWVNFGAHVEPGSKLSERPFAEQKAALLPVEHMLTGNDAIDGPTHEFIRTLPDFEKNGSLPREVNDPFADFSPRVPSSLREKLIRKDPSYKAMFEAPKKQLAIAVPPVAAKPVIEALPPVPEKEPRRRALQPIEGTGADRFRAINGALYSVGEEAPQIERAARMVDEDPEKALAIAMLERRPPDGVHPEFFYMALEEKAQRSQDYALLERLSNSRIAEEATSMGQRIAAWRNRLELSPLDDMQKIRQAREARAKTRGVDGEALVENFVKRGISSSRAIAKSTKRPSLNDMILQLVCRT